MDDIERHDWHLTTGFVGVGLLCPVLTEAGYADVAYRLLLNETLPVVGLLDPPRRDDDLGALGRLDRGAGFQTPMMNSFNHYSLGSVGEWLYEYVAGIRARSGAPGYEHVIIAPAPGELDHAEATFESVRGPIRSAWRQDDGTFQLHVDIPANVTATVVLPGGESHEIGSGTHEFRCSR